MKSIYTLLFSILLLFQVNAQTLKPYVLGVSSSETISTLKPIVTKSLTSNGFKVVGSYTPASDKNRLIIVVSHNQLEKAVQKVGGLTGFAATLRVGITREGAITNVSYTNPTYWGNAYFREDFDKVKENYNNIVTAFNTAFKPIEGYKGVPFGSKKGVEANELQEYQYMMGMPYFDDTEELKSFDSYTEAISKIDATLKKGVPNATLIYKVNVPGKELTVYGIALSGEDGESSFLPKIDISTPKHTAFLPYEILVMGDEVHMLHGRYRIAVSFPDLTMGTFTKIMSTPGDIEDMLDKIVE
ncbi:MAG: hypothetical protein OEX22_11645 [Cyclobacteriaceae bacterium]|nr:hypothetical protein [Cyclobacteriaceae bacterium]